MQRIQNLLALYVIVMTSLMTSRMLSHQMDQAMKDHILKVHNDYRASVGASNMPALEWDDALEARAVAMSHRCNFNHEELGENLAWNSKTSPETELIDNAMKKFFDERLVYSYGQYACGRACHYTQLTWALTTKVGCASRICNPLGNTGWGKPAWYLVCKYDPKGNAVGEKPFEMGAGCSKCRNTGATCEGGLCVGGTFEKVCKDDNGQCATWASQGQCNMNKEYMHKNCEKSCKVCESGDSDSSSDSAGSEQQAECKDDVAQCAQWANSNQCSANPAYMNINCKKSCNVC